MQSNFDDRFLAYQTARRAHWDAVAKQMDRWKGCGGAYHRRLAEVYRSVISPGARVLEVGCGQGDLLAALQPAQGVGVDFSPEMIERAEKRHPECTFVLADAHQLNVQGPFDVVVLSDLMNDVWDVQRVFEQLLPLLRPGSRVVINIYSRLWELPLLLVEKLGLAKPNLDQNWLTREDTANLLNLCGFEVIRAWHEVLFPLPVPLLEPFFNRILARLWPLNHLALTNFLLARPQFSAVSNAAYARPALSTEPEGAAPVVSVIVPARNEEGNVPDIFRRVPEMGGGTELIFVEGHSRDDTYGAIEREMALHPERRCKLFRQTGAGKGDAVRLGFQQASGEILMILDADLTVAPEDLPRFYQALADGRGEFINGVRLVYPMEKRAMRPLNFLGNKFFTLAFSWLLDQPVKDTLCGTKVLWKADYERIAANRAYFGDFDPFGDFDLLFGAARLGMKIVDMPIRYRERVYGSTNIQRWKHGWLLLRMVAFAAGRIKFV